MYLKNKPFDLSTAVLSRKMNELFTFEMQIFDTVHPVKAPIMIYLLLFADPNLIVIDELNRAVPGLDVHNSLENSFLPPPTAASLVGSPPLLDPEDLETKTLPPSFKVHPRGHSGPVIISQVQCFKSKQSISHSVDANFLPLRFSVKSILAN